MIDRDEGIERKSVIILRVLNQSPEPLGARVIARRIQEYGINLSERAVRYHLQFMDERGLTRLVGRRDGREITQQGIEELKDARVQDKVGFANTRIEVLAYRTTYNPKSMQGLLPVNISIFDNNRFISALAAMKPAFDAGLCVSKFVAIAREGQWLGEVCVPKGKIGFATICSIVINGVLLKAGIPMDSRFGGILEVKNKNPLRFVELIHYSGSSLDPSEAFIRARMTTVRDVVENKKGKILANFREIAGICLGIVEEIKSELDKAGINGVLSIGAMSESVCQVPVDVNKVGLILIGGLNPVALAEESGIESENFAMSSMFEYQNLKDFYHIYREMAN